MGDEVTYLARPTNGATQGQGSAALYAVSPGGGVGGQGSGGGQPLGVVRTTESATAEALTQSSLYSDTSATATAAE